MGRVGAAILGSKPTKSFSIVLYYNKTKQIGSTPITDELSFIVQNDTYGSFYDTARQNWSLQFASADAANTFATYVAIAKYCVAAEPKLVVQELKTPDKGRVRRYRPSSYPRAPFYSRSLALSISLIDCGALGHRHRRHGRRQVPRLARGQRQAGRSLRLEHRGLQDLPRHARCRQGDPRLGPGLGRHAQGRQAHLGGSAAAGVRRHRRAPEDPSELGLDLRDRAVACQVRLGRRRRSLASGGCASTTRSSSCTSSRYVLSPSISLSLSPPLSFESLR